MEKTEKRRFMESNLAFAGLVSGAVFTLASITKYYIMMNDYDRVIAYTVLGLLIMFASWGYERSVRTDNRLLEETEKIKLNITTIEDWLDEVDSKEKSQQ